MAYASRASQKNPSRSTLRAAGRFLIGFAVAIVSVVAVAGRPAQASTTTSALFPSTCVDDSSFGGKAWTSLSATANEGTYASTPASGTPALKDGATSHYLKCTNFGFALPTNATVEGIVASVERKASSNTGGNGLKDVAVRMVKAGTVGATDRADLSTLWQTTDTVVNYGGATDVWGETWTGADINATTFGIVFAATAIDGAGATQASVDYVTLAVTYRTPSKLAMTVNGGSNPTSSTAFSVVVEAQDSSSVATNVGSNTLVTLTRQAGTGTLGGTLTGTITAGSSSVTISGVTYSKAESNVTLRATASGGDTLTFIDSTFTVGPGPVSASTSTVSASLASVAANGSATSTITVTLLDANSNPVSGKTVTLDDGAATSSIGSASGNSNSSGVVTFDVTNTSGGAVVYTATNSTDGITITDNAQVTFTASKLVITSINDGDDAQAGVAFPVVVQAQDATNAATNVGTNTLVTLSRGAGTGTLGGTVTGTITAGTSSVTISGTTYSKVESGVGLTATATSGDTLTAGSSTFTATAGNPSNSASTSSFTTSPCGSSCAAGAQFTAEVTVKDSNQNLVPNAIVTVSLTSNTTGATLGGVTSVVANGTTGVSSFSTLSVDKSGTYGLQAYICPPGGANPCLSSSTNAVAVSTASNFNIVAGSPSSSTSSFTGSPGTTAAGTAFAIQPEVTVKDSLSNVIQNAVVTLSITGGAASLTGTTTVLTNSSGVAGFSGLSLQTIGGYTLTALVCTSTNPCTSGAAAVTLVSSAFTINAGDADTGQSSFTVQPCSSSCAAAQTFNTTIEVRDQYGNLASGKVVTLTSSGGTLSGTVTKTTGSTGQANFNDLSSTDVATHTLTAKICNSQSPCTTSVTATLTSSSFIVTGGGPSTITISGGLPSCGASSCQAGTSFTVTATVRDVGNNLVADGTAVNISMTASPSGAQGLTCTTCTDTTVSGVVTFASDTLSLTTAGSGYRLKLVSGAANATTSLFALNTGAADHLAYSVQPSSAFAGEPIAPSIEVTVQDSVNNTVTTSSASIALELRLPDNSTGSFSSGTTTRTASSGVATFPSLVVGTPNTYTVRATSSGLTAVTSSEFTVSVGGSLHLVVTAPSTATAAQTLSPSITVSVKDAGNNLISDSTASITVNLNGGSFASGTFTKSAVAGVATFDDLKVNTPGTYTVGASATGVGSGTSGSLVVTFGAADHLKFTVDPTDADAGANVAPPIKVTVQDSVNNTVTSSSASISLTLNVVSGTSGTTFGSGSTTTVTASSGIATFDQVKVNLTGRYNITAASTGLTSATSANFTIAATSATKLAFTNTTITLSPNTVSGALTVQRQDAGSNAVAIVDGGSLPVRLTSSSSTGVFYNTDGVTLLPGGCVTIPETASQVRFKYLDTTAGTPTLTASNAVLTAPAGASKINAVDCTGTVNTYGSLTPATQQETILFAPSSVSIAGAGLGDAFVNASTTFVNWGSTLIDSLCVKGSPVPSNGCISKWSSKGVSVVPPQLDTSQSVAVKINAGNTLTSRDNTFYYGPVITGFKGQSGPAAGGTAIQISGVGLGLDKATPPTVSWGGTALTAVCVKGEAIPTTGCISKWSGSSVALYTPAGTNNTSVAVIVGGGSVAKHVDNKFYYGALVTSLKGKAGPAAGGTSVSISGVGLGATKGTVNWGSSTITEDCPTEKGAAIPAGGCVSKWSDKAVSILSPAGTDGTSAAIRINGGGALATIDNKFYYGAVVTGLKGQQGLAAGGDKVQISGAGLMTDPADKEVPPVVHWGTHDITLICSDSVLVDCISKWGDTSVSILTPSAATAGANKVAVTVNSSAAASASNANAIDLNFYYGALVTGLKPQ